jgi:hypothetical protein
MIDENVIMIGLVVGMMMWDRLLRHRIEMTKMRFDNGPTVEIVEIPMEIPVEVTKDDLPRILKD